jgi:hypothetical protein
VALLTGAALALAGSGCFVVTDNTTEPDPPADAPAQWSVDSGATMVVSPGQGAGLFVEYHGNGDWDVYTSCDTDITDRPCAFDVIISADPGVGIAGPTLHDKEPVDSLELRSDGSFRMVTGTAGSLDGVTFTTDPGAAIRIDMLLDGEAQPDFINWVSDGAHQQNAETNPADFIPTPEF